MTTTAGPIVEPEPTRTVPADDPLWPEAPPIVPVQFGWKCPGCGQVYAPFVSKCEYCVPRRYASTTIKLFVTEMP